MQNIINQQVHKKTLKNNNNLQVNAKYSITT